MLFRINGGLSMRDRLLKPSHHWLGIDRFTPENRLRNTVIVVKSGKKKIYFNSSLNCASLRPPSVYEFFFLFVNFS